MFKKIVNKFRNSLRKVIMFTYQTTVLYCLVPKLTRKLTFHLKKH